MTELESMLEAANPVPETGPGSGVSVPPFEDVWAATQTPVKRRPRSLRPLGRGHRGRAPRPFALAGVSALTAGIVAAVLVLGTSGSGPASAFAAWSPTPTKPAHGEIAAAEARCHQPESAALVDTRGPFELLLFETRTRQLVECHTWPSGMTGYGDPGPEGKPAAPDAITTITCLSGGYSTRSHPRMQVYLEMYGLTGKNVNQVTLRLKDGATIRATTSNGLWAAWWPGSHRDESIEFKTVTATATTSVRHTTNSSEFSTNC
jgi:hypothetical protein